MFDFDVRSGQDVSPEITLRFAKSTSDPAAKLAVPAAVPVTILASLARNQALREELSEPVARIPRRPSVVVAPLVALRDALQLMSDEDAIAALVTSHGVLLGTLTERAILRRLLAEPPAVAMTPVWKVMSTQADTLLDSDTVAYAIRKLRTAGAQAMPIVRPDGATNGLLDAQDIVVWLCDRMGTPWASQMGGKCM